ncbi:MAG: hypothetical protein LQ348_006613, partial [Seirophora lacunosa]
MTDPVTRLLAKARYPVDSFISKIHYYHHRYLTFTTTIAYVFQDAPPQYPAQSHQDAGPYNPAPGGAPPASQDYYGGQQGYYQQGGAAPQQGYYNQQPPQQGYGPPQQGMYYQQGPPQQQGYYPPDNRGK